MNDLSTDPRAWRGCKTRLLSTPPTDRDAATIPFGWYQWALPTISQNGPSCVGNAWANWMEMMVRRYVGDVFQPGEQIDGDAIWKHARDMFYAGNYDDGLLLEEGFAAMMDMGILPVNSRFVTIAQNWNDVSIALWHTPLVQANHVHPGWFRPDPISGLIDHDPAPGSTDGYHATVLMATGIHGDDCFFVGQNSWGNNYARYGYFAMTETEWHEGICPDAPVTAELPAGWWEEWDGWKKWKVVK